MANVLRSPFYVPRPSEDFGWQGPFFNNGTLALLTAGGKPFSKQWRWDYDDVLLWTFPPWQMNSDVINMLTSGGKPFSRLLRWEQDDPPQWQGAPIAIPDIAFALKEGGKPFSKQWRYDEGGDTAHWNLTPTANALLATFVVSKPFSKQWRYDP